MATLRFYLKEPKAEISCIFFRLNFGAFELVNGKKKYLPLKYYINESINPLYWNKDKGRAKQDKRFRQYPEFNARLQYIEDESLSILRKLLNDRIDFTADQLRDELDKVLKPYKDQTDKKGMEFLEFLNYYMEVSGMKPNTKKSYIQTNRDLKEYESEKNIKISYDFIDIDFYNNFVLWLKNKSYSTNTIGDRIKVLKSIMRAAQDRGYHKNEDYKKKAFKRPKEETIAIYLNDEELTKLYNLDLSANKKLDNVRDWFLIAAYTGLRFSDFSRLTKDNIKDEITIKTQKTGKTVIIPLHTYVKAILEKHSYNLPKVISNQKFNEYIKDVCLIAKISEPILIEETKGNLVISKTEHKYNLVTAHTARRSFATNAYLAKVPAVSIMMITGHKTEKMLMNYIKITGQENANKLQLHPFFNKMTAK